MSQKGTRGDTAFVAGCTCIVLPIAEGLTAIEPNLEEDLYIDPEFFFFSSFFMHCEF